MNPITQNNCLSRAIGLYKKAHMSLLVIILFNIIVFMPGCIKPDVNPHAKSPGLQLILENLVSPLTLVEAPDGTKRLFVVDQVGKVWVIASDGTRMPDPFIDISSKMVTLSPGYDERGLLGFAFHPNYKTNGKFYLFYSAPPRSGGPQPGVNWNNLVRISEFRVSSADRNKADMNSEKAVL